MVLAKRTLLVPEKMKTPTKADLKNDREFAIKIAFFNSLLFCLLIAAVTYVDARLKTHVPFGASGTGGARIYRWGYVVSAVGGLLVLLGTAMSLGKVPNERWKFKSACPTAILLLVGAASLPFFRPDLEFPHGGITTWTAYLSFVSMLSCLIHYWRLPEDRLLAPNLSSTIKIERVKQHSGKWLAFAKTITQAYITALIPWAAFLWLLSTYYVTDPSERILLSLFSYTMLIGISLYAAYGIAYAAWKKSNEADDLLTKIKE